MRPFGPTVLDLATVGSGGVDLSRVSRDLFFFDFDNRLDGCGRRSVAAKINRLLIEALSQTEAAHPVQTPSDATALATGRRRSIEDRHFDPTVDRSTGRRIVRREGSGSPLPTEVIPSGLTPVIIRSAPTAWARRAEPFRQAHC